MISLRLVAISLFCAFTLSSLTGAPDAPVVMAGSGLGFPELHIGNALAGIDPPSMLLPLLMMTMPVGYLLVARWRFQRWNRRR